MLEELHITNLALIEDVRLDFRSGLTVFSGETGAGKTVLVGALKLLLGERADVSLVRSGASEAVVEGRFNINGEERTVLRRISADGRSRCYLDGQMATVSALAEAFGPLVDLHGQHEHQLLLSPSSHASYLDRFIGKPAADALHNYRDAWQVRSSAAGSYRKLQQASTQAEQQRNFIEFQYRELEAANLKNGEDEVLEQQLPRLRHGEKLAEAAAAVYREISALSEGGELSSVRSAALRRSDGLDPLLDELVERFETLKDDLEALGEEFRSYGEGISYNPEKLNTYEARLNLLSTLKRKYGPTLEEAIANRDNLANQLQLIGGGGEEMENAKKKLTAAETALKQTAKDLVETRQKGIPAFVKELAGATRELTMPAAKFEISIEELRPAEWTIDGPHRIEFLFSPNQGEKLRPLVKIASGGEASRVMLALKSVLGRADTVPVLVFDEIDTGIGGSTALAVGKRLKLLSMEHQVLVITHLAQVAVYADQQLVVEKTTDKGRTTTSVRSAEDDNRVAEIARMMAGDGSETGLRHARELLESVKK